MAYSYKEYKESDDVAALREKMNAVEAQKPADYQSQYAGAMQGLQDQYQNRAQFNYDYNTDPMYQQYKDSYQKQGKMAMQDTMGQAAAYNGGYGSSYAQTAGQQAYNQQMENLNDKIPELYNMALSRYQQEGNDILQRYSMMQQADAQDYSRWQDQQSLWQSDRNAAQSAYENERSLDYSRYDNERNADFKIDQENYDRQQNEQTDARQQLQWLLDNGITTIPDSLINASGYDPQFIAQQLAQKQANVGWQDYSGGTAQSAKLNGKTAAEWQLAAQVENILNAGGTMTQVSAVISDAMNSGTVTEEQGASIYRNASGVSNPVTGVFNKISDGIKNLFAAAKK